MINKFCVYTVLIGEYEQLNEQPISSQSGIDFICFSDNKNLTSQTWDIRYVAPIFPMDSVRSARWVKICPHRLLREYDISLYIDNSIILKKTPEDIYHDLMADDEIEMVFLKHSFRETVLDEFIAVIQLQYDNINAILEQLNAYSLVYPDVLNEKPFSNNFILRRHNNYQVIQFMEEWMAHVFRYSRRDQLSLNYCLRNKKLNLRAIDIDARNSEYFQWPVTNGRDPIQTRDLAFLSTITNYLAVNSPSAQLHEKEQLIQTMSAQLHEKEQLIQTLSAQAYQLGEIYKSRAWQLIGWLRKLRVLLIPNHSTREKMVNKLLNIVRNIRQWRAT
jgi:hypothetical protein